MSDEIRTSNNPFEFLKHPIPAKVDGVACIVIHEHAQTELGRLLSNVANVHFAVYGKDNPNTDSGEWVTFEQAVMAVGTPEMRRWINDYRHSDQAPTTLPPFLKKRVETWKCWQVEQNWYLLDLMVRERLPIVYVYQQTQTDDRGNKVYIPIPSYAFMSHALRNLKNETYHKWKRRDERDAKRADKKAKKGK